jgi:hypothetical protein
MPNPQTPDVGIRMCISLKAQHAAALQLRPDDLFRTTIDRLSIRHCQGTLQLAAEMNGDATVPQIVRTKTGKASGKFH